MRVLCYIVLEIFFFTPAKIHRNRYRHKKTHTHKNRVNSQFIRQNRGFAESTDRLFFLPNKQHRTSEKYYVEQ